jgi:diacylglycerol kinase family enzyme
MPRPRPPAPVIRSERPEIMQSRYGWVQVDPPRRPVLFVNPISGGGKSVRAAVAERARERGIEVVLLGRDGPLDALVDEAVARGADAVGVAGGDGSLAVVAAAAQAHGLPFVCVPAGTRNHFALDLGVDRRDIVGALDAFTDGAERQIDVAYVNGRPFLNNVSLGIYGEAVREPGYRDAKARTLLETVRAVLGPSGAAPDLHLVDDLGHEHSHPAVVLVSNNPYALDRALVRGTRPSLSGGRLGILVLDVPRIPDAESDPRRAPGRAWSATSVEVDALEPVHAGVDGEAVDLNPPLAFTIRLAALRVRISRRHPGASPSGRL